MNAPRQLVLDSRELNEYIGMLLVASVGPSARSGNYLGFIQCVIESNLYPYSDTPMEAHYQALNHLGLSEEQVDDLICIVFGNIQRTLANVFGKAIGQHQFDVTAYPDGRLVIQDLGPARVGPVHQFLNDWEKMIRQDMEDGHYIPPRIRRLAGF